MKPYPTYLPQITAGDAKRLFGVPEGTTHYWLNQGHILSTTAIRGQKMKVQEFSRLEYQMFLFDERAGEHQRHPQSVKSADLHSDPEFSVRAQIDQETVEYYVVRLNNGDEPPPVVAETRGDKLILLAGHHRVAAAQKVGRDHVKVYVLQHCDSAEAFYLARKSNDDHGHKPTKKDRKKTILAALMRPEYRHMSAKRLAKEFGYDIRHVKRIRKELFEPAKKTNHADHLTLEQAAFAMIKKGLEVLEPSRPIWVAKMKAFVASSKKEG